MRYNTRIALSPTGDLHLGNLRTAYFNWLAALASGGYCYLRIDDTDASRVDISQVNNFRYLFDMMLISPDDWFTQSSRRSRYYQVAADLSDRGLTQIDDQCLRLSYPKLYDLQWSDSIAGPITVPKADADFGANMVLIKSDGSPTYHFASVVDDIDSKINWVIRGKDHINNTSKQAVLYHALGADLPLFSHVGLLKKDGKPLSKRDKAGSVQQLLDDGYLPRAILNFVARLGWGPTVDDKSTKLLDRKQMLDMFLTKGKMRNSDSNVDLALLDSYNRKYKARQ